MQWLNILICIKILYDIPVKALDTTEDAGSARRSQNCHILQHIGSSLIFQMQNKQNLSKEMTQYLKKYFCEEDIWQAHWSDETPVTAFTLERVQADSCSCKQLLWESWQVDTWSLQRLLWNPDTTCTGVSSQVYSCSL